MAHFLLSLSLSSIYSLLVCFSPSGVCVYIYIYIEVSFLLSSPRLFSLASLLSVRISNNTQATLAPLFAAAHVRISPTVPLLLSHNPLGPPLGSSAHPPTLLHLLSGSTIPSRRFFHYCISVVPRREEGKSFSFRHRRGYWLETSEQRKELDRILETGFCG